MTDRYEIRDRLEFIGLDEAARGALRGLREFLAEALEPALESFYADVRRNKHARSFFRDDGHIRAAQSGQMRHWRVIAEARFDDDYVRGVRTVGETHARVGLEPRWYIAGYARITEGLLRRLLESRWPRGLRGRGRGADDAAEAACALVKAVMLDMDFALSIYLETIEADRQRLQAEREAVARDQETANQALAEALARLSGGDLRARLDADLAPEFAELKSNFNAAISALETAIGAASDSARTVGDGVQQIGSAADDLSRRTEQQAANLEETAAALDQITATVRRSAEGAQTAHRMVTEAQADAARSGVVVEQAVVAMGQIEDSSRQIERIIGAMDEIALQTNLLALNAGVEAARAGEAGKGFAVVAAEVRALAQRSAEAAKEIKTLISQSGAQVKSGVDLVGEAGRTLAAIAGHVAAIDGLVAEMAVSAAEQTRALSEVNSAVNQLDQLTQQNAAMVEQTTAATYALADQSADLSRRMADFTVSPASATARGLRSVA
ncbi:methyl-accepting chemotaxis protein [Phenylobacterium sp.]|uniref:methyl-accepting chemotaxis protein n=1 Tax=Phenylobacterium sp. TaxID=1871053 RepID=UPI002FCADA0A